MEGEETEVNEQGRIFAYCRVSTSEQTTENQVLAIRNRGYNVRDSRVMSETVSGSTMAMHRPEFAKLLERMEEGDTLIVLKIDRLGRDAIDVQQTIDTLIKRGLKVVCLDLPVNDLSSTEGRLMLQMFTAFAEFERGRIRERTKDGIERAKVEGKTFGRPVANDTFARVQECKESGLSQSKTAKELRLGIATVKRHWNSLFSNRK
ncbi:recombinase family protein [Photobacterium indicum]|uniref:recombinase family protein n=1 Tax=Photobacterium indicum TaxID=81447 RepID=UPI003D1058D7